VVELDGMTMGRTGKGFPVLGMGRGLPRVPEELEEPGVCRERGAVVVVVGGMEVRAPACVGVAPFSPTWYLPFHMWPLACTQCDCLLPSSLLWWRTVVTLSLSVRVTLVRY